MFVSHMFVRCDAMGRCAMAHPNNVRSRSHMRRGCAFPSLANGQSLTATLAEVALRMLNGYCISSHFSLLFALHCTSEAHSPPTPAPLRTPPPCTTRTCCNPTASAAVGRCLAHPPCEPWSHRSPRPSPSCSGPSCSYRRRAISKARSTLRRHDGFILCTTGHSSPCRISRRR